MTWSQKLVDCGELLDYLSQSLQPLGDKLGCVFYQLPKYVRCDVDVLRDVPRRSKPAGCARRRSSSCTTAGSDRRAVHRAATRATALTVVASDKDDEDAAGAAGRRAVGLPAAATQSAYGDDELRAVARSHP